MPTVKDLREEAKRYGLRGYSTLRKPALIQLIGDHVLNQQLAQVRAPVLRQNIPAIQAVNNLLDEPIPVETTRRLPIPMAPHPPIQRIIAPIRRHKLEKRKAVLQQFDPYQLRVLDKGKDLNRHKIPLAIEENLRDPPQYILVKETRQLRDYGAVLPVGHRLELDAATFLSGMKQNTTITLQHELGRQNGLKFEQILTVELEKEKLSVDQIFRIFEGGVHDAASDIITAVAYLKSGQKPLLHAGEIEASLGEPRHTSWKSSKIGLITVLGGT